MLKHPLKVEKCFIMDAKCMIMFSLMKNDLVVISKWLKWYVPENNFITIQWSFNTYFSTYLINMFA